MKLARKPGSTSQIFQVFIQDSSSTTGAGLAGLTNASGGLTAYYHRDTDTTATAISLVTMTVGTFTSSGFKEIDATNMPGWYQFCPPNAALAAGASTCAIHLKGASNMAPLPIEVDLGAQVDVVSTLGTAITLDANNVINVSAKYWAGTAIAASSLPVATAAGASGGVFIAGTNAATAITGGLTAHLIGTLDTLTTLTNLPSIPANWLTAAGIAANALNGKGDWLLSSGYTVPPTTAQIATAIFTDLISSSDFATAGSYGKLMKNLSGSTGAVIYPPSGTVNLASATSSSATLDASASAVAQVYQWDVLNILSGTGAGQSRIITNYTTGRVASVSPAFTTTPDATSTFDITPTASVQVVSYVSGQDPATLTWAAATRTLTALPSIPTDWLTAAGVKADAVTKIQVGLATPTNITAGTITTVTTLTNLPAITTNWLTASGIAANALNGKGDWLSSLGSNAPAAWINSAAIAGAALDGKGDWLLATSAPSNFSSMVIDPAGTVTVVDIAAVADSVQSSPSPSTTAFSGSSALAAVDGFYVGAVVAFTSGTYKGIARRVTTYTSLNRRIGVNALPGVPTATDKFVLLGRIE